MSRPGRACLNRDGTPKAGFASRSSARQSMKRLQKKTPEMMRTYKCASCPLWHIGRTGRAYESEMRRIQNQYTNERLAGRAVAALKALFNKPTPDKN